jgi:hypothetical protein
MSKGRIMILKENSESQKIKKKKQKHWKKNHT